MTTCRRPILYVLGHVGNDTIIDVDDFGDLESSTSINSVKQYDGGTAGNVSMVAAKMGIDVRLYTVIGPEFEYSSYGRKLVKNLTHIYNLQQEDAQYCETPHCFMINDKDNKQKSYIFDKTLGVYDSIEKIYCESGDIIHLTTTPPKFSIKCAKAVFENNNSLLSWCPGQNLRLWKVEEIEEMLQYVNILFLNEAELSRIYEETGTEASSLKYYMNEESDIDPIVIVTRGSKGVCVFQGDINYKMPCFTPSIIVDPTGCGDAFAGAFLSYFLQHEDDIHNVINSLKFANATASFVIEFMGCQTNIPLREDVEQRIKEQMEDIPCVKT